MLYILPPPRSPNPPSPWSILCAPTDGERGWDGGARKAPPRQRRFLRNEDADGYVNSQDDSMDANRNTKSLSECYFAGKDTALVLPTATEAQNSSRRHDAQGTNIRKHLQSIVDLLRPEETLKMAVKLESVHPTRYRYLVIISRSGTRGEESCLLGIDCNERTTVGLVLRVMADTTIRLDGDGGFSVSVCSRHHIFKPVSVQAMWSALQTLHKVSSKARDQNYFHGGMTHGWVTYYEEGIKSDRSCVNEWNTMDNLESKRPPSPDSIRTKPRERDETEKVIRATLKEIMLSVDLDEVTSKYIRTRLEEDLDMDLGEYKSFIDREMLTILGQMDAPTEIFDHVYLGSEWNASNYEELQRNGVGHILNVTREIDNFFPGTFDYLNVRVYDDEKTDLLKHWDDTFKYITKAKMSGSKVLVHCKMGVSRSASVVIAYAMKAYNWDFQTAIGHVRDKRTCIKPNTSFISQLETYQGILDAMKNKEKLQRSKSETNLKSPLNGNKTDKVFAGSEPTPVIQALAHQPINQQQRLSGEELRVFGTRPKSWSPDNLTNRDQVVVDKSPISLSLEDLSQKAANKDMSQARHVLNRCGNGESYSVSPNQILRLPGRLEIASVKERVSELEAKKCRVAITWDPGEGAPSPPPAICDSVIVSEDSQPVWTSSTVVSAKLADPFSNQLDRVFDKEDKKEDRRECPSRQSSWSSYDSAVGLGLSRHSSWGSGDARVLPSRNSSWGSYDTRPRALVQYHNEKGETVTHSNSELFESSSGIFPYDKEDIPWHPGTVRRTKQKLEEGQKSDKSSSSETLFEEKGAISIPGEEKKGLSIARLSVSAPVTSTLDLLLEPDSPLSRSDSNVSNKAKSPEGAVGIVQSLKMEFEAKKCDLPETPEKKVSSVPSSPVSLHQEKTEDLNVKNLLVLFEEKKQDKPAIRGSRFSCIEVEKECDLKRPPIAPVVRIAPSSIVKAVKKQQQYGKSHPLAKLTTNRHNNPLYNTM